MKQNKAMLTLKDLYSDLDEAKAVARLKDLLKWIETLPISHLPYVEMGFDALHEDLIKSIQSFGENIQQNFSSIKLQCHETEALSMSMVFQEQFPYWSLPFTEKSTNDYRVGDRVMNVNSTRREYVPFGLRGTVVGKTNEKVIVLFDEQFLNGNDIYGHAENYRGGFIMPNYLINLTKKFTSILNKNLEIV